MTLASDADASLAARLAAETADPYQAEKDDAFRRATKMCEWARFGGHLQPDGLNIAVRHRIVIVPVKTQGGKLVGSATDVVNWRLWYVHGDPAVAFEGDYPDPERWRLVAVDMKSPGEGGRAIRAIRELADLVTPTDLIDRTV